LIGCCGDIFALSRLGCGHQEVAGVFERRQMADAVEGRNQAFGSAAKRGQLATVAEGKRAG
jgi:hypothetical protein